MKNQKEDDPKNMNKKFLSLLIGLIVLTGGIFYHTEIVKAIGAVLRSGADVPTGSSKMQTSSGTSSPILLQNGTGTTSITFASDNFKSLTMYLQTVASSSNLRSPLNIELSASDDNIDFFTYDPTILNSASFINTKGTSTIALASTTVAYSYQPLTTGATTTKTVNVNLLPARYTRVTFTIASSTPTIADAPFFREGMTLYANMVGQIDSTR